MQSYIHYGLGFSGKYLTDEEYDLVMDAPYVSGKSAISLQFVSFTEDFEGHDWGTVVVQDLGELPNAGKFVTLTELVKLTSPHKIIDIPTKKAILEELSKFKLEHLADKVEVVIYTDNY